jgi:hypothetical protein
VVPMAASLNARIGERVSRRVGMARCLTPLSALCDVPVRRCRVSHAQLRAIAINPGRRVLVGQSL